MCRRVTCRRCGRPTWKGCGQHVNEVMAGVPRRDRCQGHADEPRTGFWARLFGS